MPTSCACLAVGLNLHETNSGKLGYRILDLGSLHPPPRDYTFFLYCKTKTKQTNKNTEAQIGRISCQLRSLFISLGIHTYPYGPIPCGAVDLCLSRFL